MKKFSKLAILIFVAYFLVGLFFLSAIMPISATRKGPEWYYDNFDYQDRLNVRIAMDYAIPRDQIIDSVLLGLGAKLASPVEANTGAYDPTVTAREFSIDKALDYMELAFGYRYNDSADTDEERLGYFSMVIMAPTTRDDRMQWAALVTKCFQEIGIDVTLKYANWNVALPRVFSPPMEKQGFDYMHGGYDAFFIGWTGSPQADVTQWFGKDNWAPAGYNLGYVDNAEVDEILDRALESPKLVDRLAAFKDFQAWFKANLPYFIVVQLMDLVALDPDLGGVSLSFDYPNYRNWTHTTATAITVQTPGDLKNMNPLMISSYYDNLAVQENYDSLITSYPDDPEKYYGNLAESWTISDDGLTWTFIVRDGIKFNDGSDLSVDDVIFTFKQIVNPDTVVYGGTSQAEYLNASSIVKVNATAVQFTLNSFYAYGETLFNWPILSKAEMSAVPDAEWSTHATTTTYAPIGTGPYMMDEANSDVSGSHVKMVLNPYYDGDLRDPDGQFVNPDMIPTINVKLISTAASCVAALKTGEINIIDSNVAIQTFINDINGSAWGRLVKVLGWGHQGFYINNLNPIWGMNPLDPREMYPEDYESEPTITETITTTTEKTAPTQSESDGLVSISPGFDYIIAIVLVITGSIYIHKRRR